MSAAPMPHCRTNEAVNISMLKAVITRPVIAGGSNGGGGRWYRGDLHAHSEHSDGANSVDEIVAYTRQVGLEYFALTDHNTIEGALRLRASAGVALVVGEELMTADGELIGLFLTEAMLRLEALASV